MIIKKKFFDLLKKYPISNIENAYVQLFLEKNHIIVMNNLLLLEIVNDKSFITEKIKAEITPPETIYELEKIFELLIPKEDQKLNGAFFTPKTITDYMSNELIKSPSDKICDPSCGCGAFLIAAIEKIKNDFDKPVSEIIKENIYGSDILDYSVRRCKIILSIFALLNNQDVEKLHFNIYCQNSLNADWGKILDTTKENGFDIIIGNPPYVKYQDLKEDFRKELSNNWQTIQTGNYNLYFAFFELGISLLKKDGKLGYIAPNNYFTSIAGISLRSFLQKNNLIEKIVDFSHLKIFDVQTYTCITFLSKKHNSNFLFERVHKKETLTQLDSLDFSINKFEDLNIKKWRLLKNYDINNIKKIESMPYTLGNLFEIRVGIATCKDAVYFIEDDTLEDGYFTKINNTIKYHIEPEITKTITKISDFDSEEKFTTNTRRIIFPYKIMENKAYIIPEQELKDKYPKCYEYLLVMKTELAERDKGKMKYPEWYAYARTQGLNFEGEKLLTPTFSNKPRFIYDGNKKSLFCNGYGIFEKTPFQVRLIKNNIGLNMLQKILNSQIMDYYITLTSVSIEGAYSCYQKNFIESFGIPYFSEKELFFLKNTISPKEIDNFLIKKYDLTF